MGAQDGMLRSLFSAMPAARRPIWLDARAATADWVDFIDVNHFGGKSAQVIIEALVHLAVHWEELYSEGGRGWRYERRRTKRLNQYDSGPSSASWLGKVHAEIDEGIRLRISPPPAHSRERIAISADHGHRGRVGWPPCLAVHTRVLLFLGILQEVESLISLLL